MSKVSKLTGSKYIDRAVRERASRGYVLDHSRRPIARLTDVIEELEKMAEMQGRLSEGLGLRPESVWYPNSGAQTGWSFVGDCHPTAEDFEAHDIWWQVIDTGYRDL